MRVRFQILAFAWLVLAVAPVRAAVWTVEIYDFYFTPTNLTVAPGDTVTWVNRVLRTHDTTHYDPNNPDVLLWESPLLARNQTFSYTFTQAGFFPYICAVHIAQRPEQTGTVTVVQANLPPSVGITNPVNGASFEPPASFMIGATASDSDGTVTSVEFFVNGTSVGVSAGPLFSVNVSGLGLGNYTLTAVATDNRGATQTSAPIDISVAPPIKYPLAVSSSPANGGGVTLNPSQPIDGYNSGTTVTLTANALNGFVFAGWSGAVTTSENPTTVLMDAAKNVTANFAVNTNATYTLTLLTNPVNGGSISASPAPNGPGGTYAHGTLVMLTATPDVGFLFTNFSGGISAETNSVVFAITSDLSVTANFIVNTTPAFGLTLATNPPGAGRIQAVPAPNAPGGNYYAGTEVELTAIPLSTNAFASWTGDVNSVSNRVVVVMDAARSLTAHFVPQTFTLNISTNPANGGIILVNPAPNSNGVYVVGTTVALAAQANPGFRFANWSGDIITTNNPVLVVMTASLSITGNFAALPTLEFGHAAASYAGLLLDEAGMNYATHGFLSLRVSKSGGYRGTAIIGGIRQSIAGQFDRFGYAPLVLRRGTLSGSLQLEGTNGPITGVLTDGNEAPTLLLQRALQPTNGASLASGFTLHFDVVEPVLSPGEGTLTILAHGVARARGRLGDGSRFVDRSFVTQDGRVPFFVPLYRNHGGVIGWLNLGTNEMLQGTVRWFRPVDSRSETFPDGFAVEVPVTGSRFE